VPSGPTSSVHHRPLKMSLHEKMTCRTVKARPTGEHARRLRPDFGHVGLRRSVPSGPTSSVHHRPLKMSLREGMAVGPSRHRPTVKHVGPSRHRPTVKNARRLRPDFGHVGLGRSVPSGPTSSVHHRPLKMSLREKMTCRTVKARPTVKNAGLLRPDFGHVGLRRSVPSGPTSSVHHRPLKMSLREGTAVGP
jgi:hypothetical protein